MSKSNIAAHTPHETAPFRHGFQRVNYPAAHQAEITAVQRGLYLREFLRLYSQHFGPFMFLAVSAGALVALFRNTRLALSPVWGKQTRFVLSVSWPGPKWPGLALVAAFFLCALWPIVMPGANVGNFHIYPRDFFLFYFMLVLTVITSIELNREPGEV